MGNVVTSAVNNATVAGARNFVEGDSNLKRTDPDKWKAQQIAKVNAMAATKNTIDDVLGAPSKAAKSVGLGIAHATGLDKAASQAAVNFVTADNHLIETDPAKYKELQLKKLKTLTQTKQTVDTANAFIPLTGTIQDLGAVSSAFADHRPPDKDVGAKLAVDLIGDAMTLGTLGTGSTAVGAVRGAAGVVRTGVRGTLKQTAKAEAKAVAEAGAKAETKAVVSAVSKPTVAIVKDGVVGGTKALAKQVTLQNAKALGTGALKTGMLGGSLYLEYDTWSHVAQGIRECDPAIYGPGATDSLLGAIQAGIAGGKFKGLNPACLKDPDPPAKGKRQHEQHKQHAPPPVVAAPGKTERSEPTLNTGASEVVVADTPDTSAQLATQPQSEHWAPIAVAVLLLAAAVSSIF